MRPSPGSEDWKGKCRSPGMTFWPSDIGFLKESHLSREREIRDQISGSILLVDEDPQRAVLVRSQLNFSDELNLSSELNLPIEPNLSIELNSSFELNLLN
ncbi:hypothetical protein OTU49_016510 [Cherax quadricarinatus]|uniref:Uncharacterized protein n=1 Tax=Cherax quadricarinatus TaxID=27406 RepID=A0AAW0Y4D8_CHEQU